MITLTDFLLARIAEDAAVANTEWPNDTGPHLSQCTLNASEHTVIGDPWCDCGYPARVLAECEAKRRIVEHHRLLWEQAEHAEQHLHGMLASQATGLSVAIRLLALPYADHPDYREEWRP